MTRYARIWSLFIAVLALNIFDWIATDLILTLGDLEANPVQDWMVAQMGPAGLFVFKLPWFLLMAVLIILWPRYTNRERLWLEIALWIGVSIYSTLAVFHIILITQVWTVVS